MSILSELGTGHGYLKAGFLGFSKSGKTYTATVLAIGTREHFGNTGRIILFDTEGGSEYIAPMIRQAGLTPIGIRSRSFSDLMAVTKEVQDGDILIVDSITHPWRELCDAHLAGINKMRAKKNLSPRNRLEFQDWAQLKAKWALWTDWYLNSRAHVIIAGRAGYEYEMQADEETEKKELVKTGIKMKTEGEFGFEPSLLVEMERVQSLDGKHRIIHRATIIGDRFGVIDGAQADNPEFKFFLPHVQRLTPGAYAPIDTEIKTDLGSDEDGNTDWAREKRERQILCEEIQALIVRYYPGQSAEEKRTKAGLLQTFFGTGSWTKVENMRSEDLRAGFERMKANLEPPAENPEAA